MGSSFLLKLELFSIENSLYLDKKVNGQTFLESYGPINLERKISDFEIFEEDLIGEKRGSEAFKEKI